MSYNLSHVLSSLDAALDLLLMEMVRQLANFQGVAALAYLTWKFSPFTKLSCKNCKMFSNPRCSMGRFAYLPTNFWVNLGVNVSKYTIPSFPAKGQLDY